MPTLLVEQARAIVAAYPPTSGAAAELDAKAAMEAIRREAGEREAIAWDEIRDAAIAVAASPPREPLWCRTWLRNRGYLALAIERRRRGAVDVAGRIDPAAERRHQVDEDVELERAETRRRLGAIPPEALARLVRAALASQAPSRRRLVEAQVEKALASDDPLGSATVRALAVESIALAEQPSMAGGGA